MWFVKKMGFDVFDVYFLCVLFVCYVIDWFDCDVVFEWVVCVYMIDVMQLFNYDCGFKYQ